MIHDMIASPAFAILMASIVAADAQDRKPLTVEQVISVTNGLAALGRHDGVCKTGADEKACLKTYDLDAATRWTIAVNMTAGKQVAKDYGDACEELTVSLGGSPGSGCGATVPGDRINEFNKEVRKLLAQKTSVTLGRIPRDKLGLDKNDIPPDILSLIIPIVD